MLNALEFREKLIRRLEQFEGRDDCDISTARKSFISDAVLIFQECTSRRVERSHVNHTENDEPIHVAGNCPVPDYNT